MNKEFTGGYTIVRGYVAQAMLPEAGDVRAIEPSPRPRAGGFGEADGTLVAEGSVPLFLHGCLPHSDGCFVKAYPARNSRSLLAMAMWRHSIFFARRAAIDILILTTPNWQ